MAEEKKEQTKTRSGTELAQPVSSPESAIANRATLRSEVQLVRSDRDIPEYAERAADSAFYQRLRDASEQVSFNKFKAFMDAVMCNPSAGSAEGQTWRKLRFYGTEAYAVLKKAGELFLMQQVVTSETRPAGTQLQELRDKQRIAASQAASLASTHRDLEELRQRYRNELARENFSTPFFSDIAEKLDSIALKSPTCIDSDSYGLLRSRAECPVMIELIWNYWHEEAMVVQTINHVAMRFQNRRAATHGRGAQFSRMDLQPLQPLSNLLWGYIQDEPQRLSVVRRAYEYDHHYGLQLYGKAIPELTPADTRSNFLQAFHFLLNTCTRYFKQEDDLNVNPDAFPVLRALKEVQLILAHGMHNQYGDLPWTSRIEMLIQQWLLSQDEMQQYLGGRPMLPYTEGWMDRVDTMKSMMGWSDASVIQFHDLATAGERILLSIRHGPWATANTAVRARLWAQSMRDDITTYVHAYRAVTGVDLTGEAVDFTLPSVHLRNRLQAASAR